MATSLLLPLPSFSHTLVKGIAVAFSGQINEARGLCMTKEQHTSSNYGGAPVSLRKEGPPLPNRAVAVTAPRSPPSPLHCAQPVAMVTGLSDSWPSHRHGVLNGPTASPYPSPPPVHGALLPQRGDVSPSPRLALCPSVLCVPSPAADLFTSR